MRFGAMNFPVLPVIEEIDTFARLGFDYLELAMDPPLAHRRLLAAQRGAITRALKDGGLGLVCHLPTFVSTADLTDSLRRASTMEMRRSLEVAADLGATKAVLHPSAVGGLGPYVMAAVKGYAFEFMEKMVNWGKRLGIVICLENMFPRNRLGVEPEDFHEIFGAFPDLRMTLDTGHANIDDRRGRRLEALAGQFGDRLAHLHVSDNQGRLDDHLAVGQGTVNFAHLVRRLQQVGYDETITLEVFDVNRQRVVESRERLRGMFSR